MQDQADQVSSVMSHPSFDQLDTAYTSQTGPLWLLMMLINLVFNYIDLIIWTKDSKCFKPGNSFNISFQPISNVTDKNAGVKVAGFWVCLVSYLIVAPICLFCHNYAKKYQSDMTLQKKLKWFTQFLVYIVGALYLAGNNLGLYAPLEDYVNKNTQITYGDLRSYLLGISLVLGLLPTIYRLFGGRLIAEPDCRQAKLIGVADMTVYRLFPMLMYTVQIDQIYTAIVDEVVHYEKESKDGSKCPRDYVIGGIVFFAAVCVIWVVTVCGVISKHINDLHKFKNANPHKETRRHKRRLVYFLFILVLYAPSYLALDKTWPWVCVARCQLQEVCVISERGMCNYNLVRQLFVGILLIYTAFGLVDLYCMNCCGGCSTHQQDEMEGSVTRQQRSADQDGETVGLFSQQRSADQDGETVGLLSQQRSADEDGETIALLSKQRSTSQDGDTIGLLSQQHSADHYV